MDEAVLDVTGLQVGVRTGRGTLDIVRDVSFRLARGQRLGLVGESGSGKSLTALAMMRLVRAPVHVTGGSVVLNGRDLVRMSDHALAQVRLSEIAMVYQDPLSALNPVQTVGAQIAEGMRLHLGIGAREARRRAIGLLESVGVPQAAKRVDSYPHEFSGGMRQRVMIAMAISLEPDVLIADEPTTALDVTTQARIVELLHALVDEHRMGVILITHDLGLAATFCSDVAVMYAGQVVDSAPVIEFYDRQLHPYSEALIQSVPKLTTDAEHPLPAIAGQPPHPAQVPAGCAFNPRCPHAVPICTSEPPPRATIADRTTLCHRAVERAELSPSEASAP